MEINNQNKRDTTTDTADMQWILINYEHIYTHTTTIWTKYGIISFILD